MKESNGTPNHSPQIDRKAAMRTKRRRRKLVSLIQGTAVAAFAFVLYWLPGIARGLLRLIREWADGR